MSAPLPLPWYSATTPSTKSSASTTSCTTTEIRLTLEVTRTPNQLMPSVAAPSATIHNARSTCGTSVPKATAMKTYT